MDSPERGQRCLELRSRIAVCHTQRTAEREADRAHKVPEPNVPSEDVKRRLPPLLLGLQHVQTATDNEAAAADDLRNPVRAVKRALRDQMVLNAWKRGKP